MLTVLQSLSERKIVVNRLQVKSSLDQLSKVDTSPAVCISVYRWKQKSKNVKSYWQKEWEGMTEKGLLQRTQELMG